MANAGVRERPIAALVLSAQERAYLERQVRKPCVDKVSALPRHRAANRL